MKTVLVLLALLLGACDDEELASLDMSPDLLCGFGEDLAWQYIVRVHVEDVVTHANVLSPTFKIGTSPLFARCLDQPYSNDLGATGCDGWALEQDGLITISAPGYVDTSVNAISRGPDGPCGPSYHQVNLTVSMQPQ